MTEQLMRTFMFGALELTDIAPELPPLESIKLYTDTYPELAHAELDQGEFVNDKMVYKVIPLKAGTKG